MRKAQAEVDSVLSNGPITAESLNKLEYVTCTIILNSISIDSFIFHSVRDKCMMLKNTIGLLFHKKYDQIINNSISMASDLSEITSYIYTSQMNFPSS